jgi:hypothetical protein
VENYGRLKMQFKTWQEFFEDYDSNPYNRHGVVSLEELYQHFKARLIDEVVADGLRGPIPLKDEEEQ